MPTFQRGHATIHYTDTGAPAGKPDAPVVFFGHGLLFSGWMFEPQMAALRNDYRCISIDWRGQGSSPVGLGGYEMDTLTIDVYELLRHLDVPVVNYVGLSMGGFVGVRLAARHPESVHTLTLLNTSVGPEEPEKRKKYMLLTKAYRVAGPRLLRKQVAPIMLAPDNLDAPWIDEWIDRLARTDSKGIIRAVEAVADRDPCETEAGRIFAPTMVIAGEHDLATPKEKSQQIADIIPQAELHVIPGAGHSSTLEKPDEITALLTRFLAANGPHQDSKTT